MLPASEDEFLQSTGISYFDLAAAEIPWDTLMEIGRDFEGRRDKVLKHTGEWFAKNLHDCDAVHSVRWRVKDTRTLMTEAIAECIVTGFEALIDGLTLPDPAKLRELLGPTDATA